MFYQAGFTFLLMLILAACSEMRNVSCDSLESNILDIKVQHDLIEWVDNNSSAFLLSENFKYGGGMIPGEYRLSIHDFNWSVLKMDQNIAQIRVLSNPSSGKEKISALSFAVVSRKSILVKLSDSIDFGVKDLSSIKVINDRIAIYCKR